MMRSVPENVYKRTTRVVKALTWAVKAGALTNQQARATVKLGRSFGSIRLPERAAQLLFRGVSSPREKAVSKLKTNTPGNLSGKGAAVMNAARVKDAGARLSSKRFEVKRPDGNPLTWGAKAVERPSEYDNALIGVWWKTALRRLGVAATLTDWERSLLAESVHKDHWVGHAPDGTYYGGGDRDGYAPPLRVKALLDDTISGGLHLNPVQLDEAVITYPLLSGQLFPFVDVKPVTGRRIMLPTIQNMTVQWGQAAGTAVTPFNTASLVASIDTPVWPVAGFIELSNELIADSPVAIGSTVTALFGERLKAELDRVIASGNGTSEPLGFLLASGLTAVNSDNGVVGPPTVSDAEALIFAVPLQYRQMDLNPAFVMNDTSYRRFRGVPVGPADERRVFGMDEQAYQLLDYPVRVVNSLANSKAGFVCLKKYRLYQRLGMEPINEEAGRTLRLSNTRLIGLRARFGGTFVDSSAAAVMSDLQQ